MARREREILEHAVHVVAEQAEKADDLVDEAIDVGHGRADPLVTHGTDPHAPAAGPVLRRAEMEEAPGRAA